MFFKKLKLSSEILLKKYFCNPIFGIAKLEKNFRNK